MSAVFREELEVATPQDMETLGERIARSLAAGDLVLLTGPLGAGKTTLTRGIAKQLGVRGRITSPTFVIARTHGPVEPGGVPLIHADAYRLGGADELEDLDLDFAGSVVVVEWGKGLLPGLDSFLEVEIARPVGEATSSAPGAISSGDWEQELIEARTVTVTGHGERWREGI